jgi:hypothetical protein
MRDIPTGIKIFWNCSGKRRDRPYRGGRSPHWIKVKNRTHAAMERVRESF